MAKIKNMHYTICLKVISSSAQVALPPAFAPLEQRGGRSTETREEDWGVTKTQVEQISKKII